MYSTLRYFGLIGLFLILPLTIALSIYIRWHVEQHMLLPLASQSNSSIAAGLSTAITSATAEERGTAVRNYFQHIAQDTSHIQNYGLYQANGQNLLGGAAFASDKGPAERGFLSAQLGQQQHVMAHYIVNGSKMLVVRSFFPVPEHNAVLELVYNLTPLWPNPLVWQIAGVALVGSIFAFIFGMVFFIARRAEGMITREHDRALDLTTQKATAEAENQEKSKFLANISHELRTPLNAIIGFSEILKDEVMGPLGASSYQEYARDIHSSGVHLLSLINDILDFSKANAGKLEIERTEVDATKLMRSSLRLIAPRAQGANIKLIEDIPSEHIVLKTDPKRLKQVLLNLLSNAVKFTPAQGSVTLHAYPHQNARLVVIEVRDTGVGIAPKDISKAMASFGQVETELSRKHEGTGLGLPLTKKLIELMGGTFDIKSKVNEGTVVSLTLPL